MGNKTDLETKTNYRLIPIEDLVAGDNVRKMYDDDYIAYLADSINQIGLINPITVKPRSKEKGYSVIAGHCRLKAIKRLNWDKVVCQVVDKDVENQLRMMIDENNVRKDVNVVEEADFIAVQMRKLGVNQKQMAEILGRSESYVNDRVAINKYPPELISALKRKKISFSVAREFAKIDNHKVLKTYLDYALESGCSPKMARNWVKNYFVDKNYNPVPKLFDESTGKEDKQEREMMTGCHICRDKFPLRNATQLNCCPDCAKQIFETV